MKGGSPMTRTERIFYLLFGGYSLAQFFLAPVYPLFLLSRGLDLLQINLILAIYLITVFVFEVPTGALADTAGRRFCFVLGCATRTAALLLYSRTRSFADGAVAEFIDAVGTTLVSGALEAWAVDGVQAEGDGTAWRVCSRAPPSSAGRSSWWARSAAATWPSATSA